MPSLNQLIDSPDDILALVGGLLITTALIAFIFFIPDLRELSAGALIAQSALIYQHFFQKPQDNA